MPTITDRIADTSQVISQNVPPGIIPQDNLQQRLQEFKIERGAEFHLTALGYFGSYARQEARPNRDIDIIFQTRQPNFFAAAVMKQELEQWFNRPVDLTRLHSYLDTTFRERLKREFSPISPKKMGLKPRPSRAAFKVRLHYETTI